MEPERKIVKHKVAFDSHHVESEKIKDDLHKAMSEYDKVKQVVDYFVLGLFMVVILYTLY